MTTAPLDTVDEGARRRFESAWKEGPAPRIEEFLPAADDPRYAATVLELVAIDMEMSWRRGAGRTAEEYIARFPLLAEPERVRELAREEERARRGAQQRLEPGARLGRYQLEAVHAKGGFGVVWRAHDATLGREVAVKIMAGAHDEAARQRFVAEARTASRLEHPGVVPVHELAEGDAPWYSMKLVRGQTLAELMQGFAERRGGERAIAWHRLLEVFHAVARALAFAHARGLMHRDVKPANIIVGDFGETVLLDWGLARPIAGPAEPDGTVMGTPGYWPPEQEEGRVSAQDARSDVYALGAILDEILALERSTPRALRAIARKARAKRPEDRYADASALAEDIERALSHERVSAHREAWWEKLARSIRRHRTAWAVGTVAVVLSIAGAMVALWIKRDAELRRQRDVYAAAVRDETRAKASLVAGRPAEAVAVLDQALAALAREDQAAMRARMTTLREQARRVDIVVTANEAAWFLSGEERDADARREIERALTAAGTRCAEVEPALPPERVDQCKRTTHRLMLLDAVLLAKGAIANLSEAGPVCDQVYAAVQRARADAPTSFGNLVESFCARLTGKAAPSGPSAPSGPDVATTSSTDAYMFGLIYFYLGQIPPNAAPVLNPIIAQAGLDMTNPTGTAIDRFREAVRLEPGEYWHSFMLANALAVAGDFRAAGLVLEHCIALRPDYPRALEARGLNMILQGQREQRPDLVALGRADFDRVLQIAPQDPWTHWARASLQLSQSDWNGAMNEYLTALALDPDGLGRVLAPTGTALSTASEAEAARAYADQLARAQPDNALAWTVHAAASLALGDDAGAQASIDRALALTSAPPLARTVRGLLALRANDPARALPDLDGADPLTVAARQRALEATK